MTKRAATAAFVAVLLAFTGCRPAPPVSGPPSPSPLSDAPPDEVSGLQIPATRIDDAIARVPGTISKAVFAGNTLNLQYYDANKLGAFTR
jgi:hypothetical protein